MGDKRCEECEGELESMKWELLDGHGKPYGYACDNCAGGAFDRYYESMVE